MEAYVLTMFWLNLLLAISRIMNIATGAYGKPVSLNVYAADTVFTASITIWAAFVVWYN